MTSSSKEVFEAVQMLREHMKRALRNSTEAEAEECSKHLELERRRRNLNHDKFKARLLRHAIRNMNWSKARC